MSALGPTINFLSDGGACVSLRVVSESNHVTTTKATQYEPLGVPSSVRWGDGLREVSLQFHGRVIPYQSSDLYPMVEKCFVIFSFI